jgi:hypothetical protein
VRHIYARAASDSLRTLAALSPYSGAPARAGAVRPVKTAAGAAGLPGCRPGRSACIFPTSPPLRAGEVGKTPSPQDGIRAGKNEKQKSKDKHAHTQAPMTGETASRGHDGGRRSRGRRAGRAAPGRLVLQQQSVTSLGVAW